LKKRTKKTILSLSALKGLGLAGATSLLLERRQAQHSRFWFFFSKKELLPYSLAASLCLRQT
jgi:hypothetical protein